MSALDDLKESIDSAINNSKPIDGIDPFTVADRLKAVADFSSTNPGPKGDTGLTGATGAQGPTGAQGVKGDTGAQGIQGVKGNKGDQGERGFTGDAGEGVPAGGLEGQILVKLTSENFDATWSDGNSAINGLTKTGTNIGLGGELIDNTTINGGDYQLESLHSNGEDTFSHQTRPQGMYNTYHRTSDGVEVLFDVGEPGMETIVRGVTSTQRVLANIDSVTLDRSTESAFTGINIGDNGIQVSDTVANIGMFYTDDNSEVGLSNERWIPDLAAVKSIDANSIHKTGDERKDGSLTIGNTGNTNKIKLGFDSVESDGQYNYIDFTGYASLRFDTPESNYQLLSGGDGGVSIQNTENSQGVQFIDKDITDSDGKFFLKENPGFIPSNDNNVIHKSGNETNLQGDKEWKGTHVFPNSGNFTIGDGSGGSPYVSLGSGYLQSPEIHSDNYKVGNHSLDSDSFNFLPFSIANTADDVNIKFSEPGDYGSEPGGADPAVHILNFDRNTTDLSWKGDRILTTDDITGVVGDPSRAINVAFMGSSITAGVNYGGITNITETYVYKTSKSLGVQVTNLGVSGRTLQQVTVGDNSIYSNKDLIPPYTTGSYIVYECMVNDVIKDPLVYTSAIYQTQLEAVIDSAIALGYPANHIVIYNGSYYNPPAYPSYGTIEARHDEYAPIAQAVSIAKGTLFLDDYYTFKAALVLDSSLLEVAALHPTATGDTWMANSLSSFLSTYIEAVSFTDPASTVVGSQYVYLDSIVGNDLLLNKAPLAIPVNSTQPLLGYDTSDKRVKTKTLYPVDVYNVFGAASTTGVTLDFNDATNFKPGFIPALLAGNTATNGPTSNSGSYHIFNVEYSGTANKTGSGNVTQLAFPYTTATSQTNGFWYRGRTSANVFSNWVHLMGSSALAAAGQIPIGQTGGVYTNTTLSGDATITSGGVVALKNTGTAGSYYKVTTDAQGRVTAGTALLTGSATLDFPSTAAQSSSELTITVSGASDGDVVSIGVPNASSNANSCYTARVSATNTVTVKFNNYSAAAIDPASGVFKVTIFK
jgi:hypothetical protein